MIILKTLISKNIITRSFLTKKSRFITYISKVTNKTELENFIKKHSDKSATHNCYAFKYGHDGLNYGYNNDGEPNGTAGEPLLKLIEVNNVTDIIIFVKRYYGGIKLGTGGLQKAYTNSAIEIIKESEFKKLRLLNQIEINFKIADIKIINLFLIKKAEEVNYTYANDLVTAQFKLDEIKKLDFIKDKINILKIKQGYY
ncbi:IMPACT family protein [Spiroplasma cantharicola]|uniref:Impact N-terminal domain-containing protein n=1 Tax=Spiroplasma cantharicola TaxID=362837 RepID=A0A0M4KDT0_9MOLU|nr:YigZ family protein [Spiroplasma cantharicola]ALD65970.1 hypothetical protein SCANT_v1c00600 [Spiroplasma cantharicola]